MKVFISCDMEGVTPVVFYDEVGGKEEAYKRACEWMTEEVNAAVSGAFDAGAETVRVCDAHASGRNIIPEKLDERAELVRGNLRPKGMMEGLDESFDSVLFVGYHAKAGATPAILPHSYSGRLIIPRKSQRGGVRRDRTQRRIRRHTQHTRRLPIR